MNILADANITGLASTFGRVGKVRLAEGRDICREMLDDTEILLVRSVTRVDEQLLVGSPVRFVGTATIGHDHLDTAWLDKQGIGWANAPGCNADAAAQYALAMMILACNRLQRPLAGQTVGIIGRGNVGSRLQRLLSVLGVPTCCCDPPLAECGTPGLVTLREALSASIVSLHVPLTSTGAHPTRHLLNHSAMAAMIPGSLLVNTARGAVIDPQVLATQDNGKLPRFAFDVWPGEPGVDPALIVRAVVATPHVAGYSIEGKTNGATMIFAAWQRWAGRVPTLPGPEPHGQPCRYRASPEMSAEQVILAVSGIETDDATLRELAEGPVHQVAPAFDLARKNYRQRHDFGQCEISAANVAIHDTLRALGFRVG